MLQDFFTMALDLIELVITDDLFYIFDIAVFAFVLAVCLLLRYLLFGR